MNDKSKVITAVAAEEGHAVSVGGGTYRIVISGEQTGGAYGVIEMVVPPNGGPGPHAHAGVQESFYVLEGEIEFKNEAGTYTATKGAFVNIPLGGLVHCFKNRTDTVAKLLCTVQPAGMEKFFEEIGKPVEWGTFLPPPEMTPEAMDRLTSIGEKYGQKFYPPNYLDK